MPLYEYECRNCRNEFEKLVRANDPPPTCPECGSGDLAKLLHQVAVSTEHTRETNLTRARERAKKVNKDKQIAQFEYEEKHRHHH